MPKRLEILAILRLRDCDVCNKHLVLPHHIALLGQGMLVNCKDELQFKLLSHQITRDILLYSIALFISRQTIAAGGKVFLLSRVRFPL